MFKNFKIIVIVGFILFLIIGFSNLGESIVLNDLLSADGLLTGNLDSDKPLESDEVIITRVIDGDTILVINSEGKEERVRLLLVDTPESFYPDKPEELFGKESTEFAKKHLTRGKIVKIERGNPDKDEYNRTLAYIFIDGVNFNQLLIEEGYARIAYVFEPNTKYLSDFKQAEKRAKEQKKNIWSIPGYVTENGFDMSVIDQ